MDIKAILDALDQNDFTKLHSLINSVWFEYSEDEEPKLMDSIASLVDKISTVNFKMAYNQDVLYRTRRQTPEEFTETWNGNMEELHMVLKRCLDLNCQRNRLIDELDQKVTDAITGKIDPSKLTQRSHKTY